MLRRAQEVVDRDDAVAKHKSSQGHPGPQKQKRGRDSLLSLDDEEDAPAADKENIDAATASRGDPPRRSRGADPRPLSASRTSLRSSRSSSPIPDSSLAKQRFERLEHMYDKVRSRMSWRSSDSEDEDD